MRPFALLPSKLLRLIAPAACAVLGVLAGTLPPAPAHAQITVGSDGVDTSDHTSYSGTSTLTKIGSNQVYLTNRSTYSGTTYVTAGTLRVIQSGVIFTSNNPNTSYVVSPGAILVGGAAGQDTAAFWGRPITLNGGTLVNDTNNEADALSSLTMTNGVVNGNAYRVYDGSVWTLSGSNTINTNMSALNFGGPVGITLNTIDGTTLFTKDQWDYVNNGNFIVKSGSGTLVITGNIGGTGVTTIQGGTLQVGNGGTSGGVGAVAISSGATLAYNRSDAVWLTAAASGSGSIVQANASGILVLEGPKSHSGGTIVSRGRINGTDSNSFGTGTVTLGDANSGSANTDLLMNSAGSVTVTNNIVVSSQGAGSATIADFGATGSAQHTWTGTLTLGRSVSLAAQDTTYRSDFTGRITGAGGITILQGRVMINNQTNDFTGGVAVNGGTILQLNAAEVVPNANAVTVNGSLDFAYDAGGVETVGDLSGSGVVRSALSGTHTLAVASTAGSTFAGTISDGSGRLNLAKSGTGTLLLSGSNTYSGSTTISGGTLQVGNGGTAGSLGSGAVVNNGSLVVNRSDNLTMSQAISGSGGLTKLGGGILTLSGSNSFSGGLALNGGGVLASSAQNLNAAGGAITFNGGTLITGNAVVDASRAVTLGASGGYLSVVTGGTLTIAAGISGAGGLGIGFDAGVAVLSGSNSYAGSTTIGSTAAANQWIDSRANPTLRLGNANALPSGRDLAFGTSSSDNTATLDVNGYSVTAASLTGAANARIANSGSAAVLAVGAASGTATFSGQISGNISFVKNNAGTQVLGGTSSYTGTTSVNAGTLQVNSSGTIFTPSNPNTSYAVASGATLIMGSSTTAALWGRPVAVNGGTLQNAVSDDNDALDSLTMSGGTVTGNAYRVYDGKTWQFSGNNTVTTRIGYLTFGGTTPAGHTFNVTDGTTTMSGVISDVLQDGGPQFLRKTGAGTLALTGANTYAGETRVQAGELKLNGSLASALVSVAAGATLSGTGSIAGDATIAGIHAPGNSPGIQTVGGGLTYSAGSGVTWELTGNTAALADRGIDFDGINVGGNLTFSGATVLSLAFNNSGSVVNWNDPFWSTDKLGANGWLLYDVANSTTGLSNLSINQIDWLDASNQSLLGIRPYASFGLEQVGGDVYLTFQAVPEPSSLVLLGIGGALAGLAARRRR